MKKLKIIIALLIISMLCVFVFCGCKKTASNPVNKYGKLSVSGTNIVDENGTSFQLKGFSTLGLTWFSDIINEASFKSLRDDLGANCIRASMYIDENGDKSCYLENKSRNKELMINTVDYCIDLGMYVIVDWHILNPGDPSAYTDEAVAFFKEMSEKYKDVPNVIYEICNEPNGSKVKWDTVIKPYCETVISAIRENSKDSLIICGTGSWCQDIDAVIGSKIEDENVVYSVHYYASTHKQWLRDRVKDCYDAGIPMLISEFGVCAASGDGKLDLDEAQKWFDFLDELKIGYVNWSISDKKEAASVFKKGTDLTKGNWTDEDLTESGLFVKNHYLSK